MSTALPLVEVYDSCCFLAGSIRYSLLNLEFSMGNEWSSQLVDNVSWDNCYGLRCCIRHTCCRRSTFLNVIVLILGMKLVIRVLEWEFEWGFCKIKCESVRLLFLYLDHLQETSRSSYLGISARSIADDFSISMITGSGNISSNALPGKTTHFEVIKTLILCNGQIMIRIL